MENERIVFLEEGSFSLVLVMAFKKAGIGAS